MIADCQSLVEDMPPVHPWETFSLTRLENLRPDFTPHNFQYFSVYRAICQRIFVIGLQTGLGKCLGKGTSVIKFDGSVVLVEDLKAGDLLMGPDSLSRKILSTCQGVGPLYRIIPTKGESWVCNDVHMLTLVHTETGQIIDIPLDKYLTKNKTFKHCHKLFQPEEGVDFEGSKDLEIPGYFLGLWIGDGTKALKGVCITSIDQEIIDYCRGVAESYGLVLKSRVNGHFLSLKGGKGYPRGEGCIGRQDQRSNPRSVSRNPILDLMRQLMGVGGIPQQVLTASRDYRLEVLAGILDSDGYLIDGVFEVAQKCDKRAEGIMFLARSLGFRVTHRIKWVDGSFNKEKGVVPYHRMYIQGEISSIPTRLPRKQANKRLQKKRATRTGFKVESIGDGDYYGFELDGDGRFLLGDFTVTHNTLCSYLAYFYYKSKFPNTKFLVFTSNSGVLQFRNELDKFFDHDCVAVAIHKDMNHPKILMAGKKNPTRVTYAGARKLAYEGFAKPSGDGSVDLLVMNYAVARRDVKQILSAIKKLNRKGVKVFSIFDEATNFKSLSADTHHVVHAIAGQSERVLGLTATLTKGRLEEIYGIFKALGFLVAPTKEIFEDYYCIISRPIPKKRFIKKIDGYKNTAEFVNLIKDLCIVLRKRDVAKYLPAFTPQKIMLEHSPAQFALIGRLMSGVISQAHMEEEDEGFVERSHMQRITKLTEVGYVKRALQDVRLVTKSNLFDLSLKSASPKTKFIIDRLQNEFSDEKIVIYTSSKVYVNLLRDTIHALARKGEMDPLYSKVLTITGDVAPIQREEYKKWFTEKSDYNLIIINDAGSDTINLQAASVLIVVTLPKTGGDLVQLAGRLSRLGSKHSNLLLYYLLVKDSQDLDEYLSMQKQMQIMAQVLGEAEQGLIDYDSLKALEIGGENLSEEEYKNKSMYQLLFHSREKREGFYFDPARMAELGVEG